MTLMGSGEIARLWIDGYTVEVINAMRAAGIRPVLLKGSVVAEWLYRDVPEQRLYGDADLLVSPADLQTAREVLATLGFRSAGHPPMEADEHHAREYVRDRDGANVDLHRTMHGMERVPFADMWEIVGEHLGTSVLLGTEVDVPDRLLLTLNTALHIDPLDEEGSKSWNDLHRALVLEDEERWRQAWHLACRLGIESEFAVRLRRLPEGSAMADRLGMRSGGSTYYNLVGAVTRGELPSRAYTISRLEMQPGLRAKGSYVIGKLVPPKAQLMGQSRLARRGRIGYALARAGRVGHCFWHLPEAVALHMRARPRP